MSKDIQTIDVHTPVAKALMKIESERQDPNNWKVNEEYKSTIKVRVIDDKEGE